MTAFASTLYPDWSGPAVALPPWVHRYGLSKYRPIVQRVYASADKWQQAEADGIPQIAPMIVKFNKNPAEIKAEVGSETWKAMHHASLKSNVDRLVLTMVGGWTLNDAMLFPAKERFRAMKLLAWGDKAASMLACRLAENQGELQEFYTMARDVGRMGGTVELDWGRKRLKREHDAAVIKYAMSSSDPTPWADAWFFDAGDYSFSLLKSHTELVIDGGQQRHCVASYAGGCKAGEEVVLRIEGAERATCSWAIREPAIQVRGFANSAVSPACIAAAKEARLAYTAHVAALKRKAQP